jgi:hypothetical protein
MSNSPKYVVRLPVELPSTAKKLVAMAGALGFAVEARSPRKDLARISVGGTDHERGVAFVAEWVDGRTGGAGIYRARTTYELVVDDRPEHDARRPDPKNGGRTIAALNRKPNGIGSHRSRYLGGPRLPAHVTLKELVALLEGLE